MRVWMKAGAALRNWNRPAELALRKGRSAAALWLGILSVAGAAGGGEPRADLATVQARLLERMQQRAEHFGDVSRRIWEFAEVGYQEYQSAALLESELELAGFQIRTNIAEIPTAFMASWGMGRPVIGILGEYDALPGLFQESVPEQRPAAGVKPGHGCGHNLFGAGSAFAAISVKEILETQGVSGTIRFYGCPAEEGGGGKIYMARAGVFDDCDVVLHWHPGSENRASLKSNLANITAKFRYHGAAAHAAGAPEKGRSALDAVALMTHAVDLLREHVPATTRIHYIITHGGSSPNVVPAYAEIYLYARHPDISVLDGIWSRIGKCAEAGALATETKLEVEMVNSAYNLLPNDTLTELLDRNLRHVGGVIYTEEERAFAEALRRTFSVEKLAPLGSERTVQKVQEGVQFGSTDVGDVSWVVPTGGFYAASFVPGTPGHSWQATACAGSSLGRKGMVVAARTLALSALELVWNPELVAEARASFERRRAGKEYRSRLPAEQKPPLDYRR